MEAKFVLAVVFTFVVISCVGCESSTNTREPEAPVSRVLISAKGKQQESLHQNRLTRFLQSRLEKLGVTVDESDLGPISNYEYGDNLISLVLGDPLQAVSVIYDSMSSDFWITSKKCQSEACQGRKSYNSASSKSYKPNGTEISANYVKGSMKGHLSVDNFIFVYSQFSLTFGEATELSDEFKGTKFDGILGLSADMMSNKRPINPVAAYLRYGSMKYTVSSSLGRKGNNPYFVLGDPVPKLYSGPITYAPLTHKVYWQFKLDDVAVAGSNALAGTCTQGCQAIADTGSSLIYGPAEAVQKLNKAIGATKTRDGAWLLRSCDEDQLPNVVFTVAGNPLPMSATTYVIEEKEGDKKSCYSSFVEVTGSDSLWILGSRFSGREYYTILEFDNQRVGFAQGK